MIEVAIIIAAVIITIAIIPVIIRMTVGPTILDRTVGADMMFVFALMGLLLYTAATGELWAVGGMLAITGLGFIGTLAVARFVAREPYSTNTKTGQQPATLPANDADATDDADPQRDASESERGSRKETGHE